MKRAVMFGSAALFAAFAFGGSEAEAGATYLSTTCAFSERYDDETTCASSASGAQQNVDFSFTAEGPPTAYLLRLKAPVEHCSKVKYLVYRQDSTGGYALIGVTGFLDGGLSDEVPIDIILPRGPQNFQIGATGKVGGCNTGVLQSWGVHVEPVIIPQ